MTMRSFVQSGAVGEATAEAVELQRALARTPDPKHHAAAPSPSEPRPAVRCSPDPCIHTDRYRLVTPFSLRL